MVTTAPGLYFVGLPFQYSFGSMLVAGVGRDAEYVVKHLTNVADMTLPVAAGAISAAIFTASVLPMLVKAARSRDLASYSLGNLVLANLAT